MTASNDNDQTAAYVRGDRTVWCTRMVFDRNAEYIGPPTPLDGPRPIGWRSSLAIANAMTIAQAAAALLRQTANATPQ